MQRQLKKVRTLSGEEWGVALFGATFLLGVWYAFPMVNTVSDVWAFGGGVLRSLAAHSFLPGGDLAYGTVSFYQNYLAMVVALGISYVLTGFDMEAVRTAFILHPHYSLLVPRIVSALTAMVFLYVVYRFLVTQVSERWWRLALLLLLFGNVITIFLTRSGKMWILSMLLITLSFIYLYRSLTTERQQGLPGRYAFVSLVTAALAAANFFFAAQFFVALPILAFAFPKTRLVVMRLIYMSLASATVFLVIFLLNAENIIHQVSAFVPDFLRTAADTVPVVGAESLSLFEAFRVKARHALEAFPLFLVALIAVVRGGVRNRTLAALSLGYGALYFCALVFVFRTDHQIALNVRHVFPLAVFLMFFLAAFHPPRKLISIGLAVISLLFYVYTVTLLSVPATYNDAYQYIVDRYGDTDTRIEEHIFELTLPMNQASFALFGERACASTCQYRLSQPDDIAFQPLVITAESDPKRVGDITPDVVVTEQQIPDCTPVARFGNAIPDTDIYDIDINLGRVLTSGFYSLQQLGKNLYIYETTSCPAVSGPLPQKQVRWF